MSNLHRILWIDQQIRTKRYPNVKKIAEKFEISVRQATRDLSYLRDTLSAPIQYSHKHQGYGYIHSNYALPSIFLTEEQQNSLVYLSMQYRQSGEKHEVQIADILERLVSQDRGTSRKGTLPYPRKIPVSSELVLVYQILSEALAKQLKVRVNNEDQDKPHFILSPYKIFTYRQITYVLGFVEPFNDIHLYPLHKLHNPTMTEETFDFKPLISGVWFAQSFLRVSKTADVRFHVPEYVKQLKMPWVQLNHNTFRIEFEDLQLLFSRLLACPTDFQILSPYWCVNRFKAHFSKILRNHTGTDTICPTQPVQYR